jgi:hypothetical protein
VASLQHSTAQGAQNRPNAQYSAAQTAQNRPNGHYSTDSQGAQRISISPPSNSSNHQIQLRGTNIAGSQIFFPQDSAQNRSNTAISKPNVQYSTAKTAQSMPKVHYSAAQTAQITANVHYSTAQTLQSMPNVQYSAAQTAQSTPYVSYSAAKTAHSMPTIQYSVVAQGAQNTQMISPPKIQLSESTNQILVNNVQYFVAPKPAQNMNYVQKVAQTAQNAQNMPNLYSVFPQGAQNTQMVSVAPKPPNTKFVIHPGQFH